MRLLRTIIMTDADVDGASLSLSLPDHLLHMMPKLIDERLSPLCAVLPL